MWYDSVLSFPMTTNTLLFKSIIALLRNCWLKWRIWSNYDSRTYPSKQSSLVSEVSVLWNYQYSWGILSLMSFIIKIVPWGIPHWNQQLLVEWAWTVLWLCQPKWDQGQVWWTLKSCHPWQQSPRIKKEEKYSRTWLGSNQQPFG